MKKLLLCVLLAVFNATSNAQVEELNSALAAIKSKASDAKEVANVAYKKNKKDPEALIKIARAFFEQKDIDGARQFANYANEAAKPKYQYAPSYLLLGDIESANGNNVGMAANYYQQAINFAPTNPEGYKKWAKVYREISPSQADAKLEEMKKNCPKESLLEDNNASAIDEKSSSPQALPEKGNPTLEYNFKLEKPGTILDQLPIDMLDKINSLTIVGILDENDIAIINKCKSLKFLDLSHCYTTLSEKLQKERNSEKEFLHGLFQAAGELGEAQYRNGEIGVSDYLRSQVISELGKDANDVKQGSDGCIIVMKAFKDMTSLEKVILPYRATIIEGDAFSGCTNLETVQFPLYLKQINGDAFLNCKNLKKVKISSALSFIHNTAFAGCTSLEIFDLGSSTTQEKVWRVILDSPKLKTAYLPKGILDITVTPKAEECFIPSGVEQLHGIFKERTLHFKGNTPPTVKEPGYQSFAPQNCTIYVPKGSMTAYYATMGDGNKLIQE